MPLKARRYASRLTNQGTATCSPGVIGFSRSCGKNGYPTKVKFKFRLIESFAHTQS
jgi:hypothetical protein